jgi:phage gpG-like protein
MTVRVSVNINLPLADRLSSEAVERGVRAATIETKNLVIETLSQPGRGRLYRKGKTVVHRASAPGAPPAPDTGRLRNSTQSEVFRTSDGALGVVSVNTEYAAALELGTDKIAARPFIGRLARDHAARIQAAFRQYARLP